MKKKQLKNRIIEIKRKLIIATELIWKKEKQIIKAVDKLTNMYESQLKVQDSEMRRLNIIIDNYEVKLNITVKG
tara:strand:+ start:1443 stop:1664 length:222 start_codon:yes stop_codon:yes gene_type:complete